MGQKKQQDHRYALPVLTARQWFYDTCGLRVCKWKCGSWSKIFCLKREIGLQKMTWRKVSPRPKLRNVNDWGKVFTLLWGKWSFTVCEGQSFPVLSGMWPGWDFFPGTLEEALANKFQFPLFSFLFQGCVKVIMVERTITFGLNPSFCLVIEPSKTFELAIPLIFSQITDSLVSLKKHVL